MGQLIELMSIGVTTHKTNNVQEQKQISNLSILLRTDLIHFRYGDIHPQSGPGYFVGAVCTIAGMLATGLPIPIIASNFNHYYSFARYFLPPTNTSYVFTCVWLSTRRGSLSGRLPP